MKDLTVDGMAIAPGVVETIVSIAVNDVDGVAAVGSAGTANRNLRSMLGAKPSTQGIDIDVDEEGALVVTVHVDVFYGYVLPDLAESIRQAVDSAIASQVGLPVGRIDVYVDGIQFAN